MGEWSLKLLVFLKKFEKYYSFLRDFYFNIFSVQNVDDLIKIDF